MRIQHAIALAVVVGLALGVIATQGLAAQGKRTFYVVVEIDEITDADGYKAMPLLNPSSGSELVAATPVTPGTARTRATTSRT